MTQSENTRPAPRRHRVGHWLLWIAAVLGALVLLLAGLMLAAVTTEWGARTVWQLAQRALPGELSGKFAGGTLSEGIALRDVTCRGQTKVVKIDKLTSDWHVSHSPLKLTIESLRMGTLDVTLLPSPPEPRTLPQEITLPLAVELQQAALDKLVLHQEGSTRVIDDIRLHGGTDGVHHRLVLDQAVTPYGTASAALKLDGTQPFALSGNASLDAKWREERYRIDARLSGTLQALGIELEAVGDRLSGEAEIEATPFAPVPFRRAQIDVHHLNPRMFSEGAPQADLDVRATLTPTSDTKGGELSSLAVTGPVSITNAKPGALDKGLLPLVSANADVTLDAQTQQLSQVDIKLPGGGTLEGGGTVRGVGDGRLQGEFALQAQDIDLHALRSALRHSQLDGPLSVEFAGDTQQVELALSDPEFSISANADITPQQIEVGSARLQAGDSVLQISGTMARNAESTYLVSGELHGFDPGRFLTTLQPAGRKGWPAAGKNINARINAEFSARGRLQPEAGALVEFDVHDSTYENLLMTGGGVVHISGTRVLPSDAQLSIAGNQVALKGSFGVPSDRLNVDINAPALARLGIGLSGQLQLDGVLGGTLKRPVLDASFRAEQLAFGDNRIAQLSGEAHTQGVPGSDPNARVQLDLNARSVRSGEIDVNILTVDVGGTYASHTIELTSTGELRGSPLDVTLAAQGRLHELPEGLAWNGVLRTLENRGLPRISMSAPLTVSITPDAIELGATRLTVARATIELNQFRYTENLIASAGTINALDIGRLFELRRQITGAKAPVNTTLVLDGSWDFRLTEAGGSGFLQVERQGGDIDIPGAAGTGQLGLTALALRANLHANRIELDAQVASTRVGQAEAQGQIALQTPNRRLLPAPDAPISGTIIASIPRLQSIASLAGPRILVRGNASLDLRVDGTLADPSLSGAIDGEQLSVTLFDQGVRLRDGTAHLTLDNNVVELRNVQFEGGEGTLRVTGRIPLERPKEMIANVTANNLQLLASPSGQLTVSGQARVASVDEQLQVTGKFVVDRALFSLPEKSPPRLGDDVVVIRGGKRQDAAARRGALTRASTQPASPLTPRVNVEIFLGDDFRFRGAGADVSLTGRVTVESAPGDPLQAYGTVRVTDGTYEAFGAELTIERGVINFQGPPTNPNITILAMRRDQEVGAGVRVTGTVNQPRVQLVSEPDVPEAEKLSWLVFGRGGGDQPGQAQAAAQSAALGLLNRFGGERIAGQFGLDQLSIGSSEYGLAGERVVSLGKEISDRLYVGYEQSLAGAESVLKLTYELTQHWSVILRGGSITGLDVFYSNRFDELFGR